MLFENILPVHIAKAMAAETPGYAVSILMAAAGGEQAEYSIDCSDTTWSATSLSVRHGLLMEWLAAEAP